MAVQTEHSDTKTQGGSGRKPGSCALLLAFCLVCSSPVLASADSVVAVVGTTPILESDIGLAMDFVRLAGTRPSIPDSVLRREVLKQLIDNELLQERARQDTVDVTRDEVSSEVDAQIATLRERFPDEEQFVLALAAEGVTERSLRRRYEDDVRRKLLARKLLEKEGLTRTYISPAEAERFYSAHKDSIARVPGRVRLAHILIPVMPGPAAESVGQRRASEVLDVLARGGDFAVVAGSFSDDKKTAAAGGDQGWQELSSIAPELAMVLSQLKPGQISPPFRTLDGYLITRLEAVSGKRTRFSTILVRVPIRRADTLRALSRARSVRDRALAGVPFESLAVKFSQDPMTADSGGFLGEFLIAGLSPPFDEVVTALDSGEVSEPVLSEHGYHIIKALDKNPERVMEYLEMQDAIRNYLQQEKSAERLVQYLGRIADKTYIWTAQPD